MSARRSRQAIQALLQGAGARTVYTQGVQPFAPYSTGVAGEEYGAVGDVGDVGGLPDFLVPDVFKSDEEKEPGAARRFWYVPVITLALGYIAFDMLKDRS